MINIVEWKTPSAVNEQVLLYISSILITVKTAPAGFTFCMACHEIFIFYGSAAKIVASAILMIEN